MELLRENVQYHDNIHKQPWCDSGDKSCKIITNFKKLFIDSYKFDKQGLL